MKLSLAIITGNIGGKLMTRFLDNFMPFVDEVIVVRAIGNQAPDDSLDVAKARGCVVSEYFNHKVDWPHVDDFAAARNLAWSLATGDWIMWADTDDVIATECGALLREVIKQKGDKFDVLITPYCVPDAGLGDNPRERVVRRGIARWESPVHECLGPINPDDKWRTASEFRIRIVHDPGPRPPAGRNGRNLRILESIPDDKLTTSLRYHLFAEHFAMGNHEQGAKAAEAFLMLPDAGRVERFECMLSLSMIAKDDRMKAEWLKMAYHECPERREPLVMLSNIAHNAGHLSTAESYLKSAAALPTPNPPPWNLRRKMYGWQMIQEQARLCRSQGNFAKADALEFNHFVRHGGKISLLHATRGRAQQAVEMRNLWLERAENPDAIEHIFGCDPDDTEGPMLGSFRHIVQDAGGGPCGAWNMAATIAHGEVLVQVSDDMYPPQGWDRLVLNAIGDTSKPSVLRVSDGHRTDGLIVLAVVTRAWVRRHGYLFHPTFFSMFSDNWLTECAEKAGAIIDARDIVFEHRHPYFTGDAIHPTTANSNGFLHYAEGWRVLNCLRAGKHPETFRQVEGIGLDFGFADCHAKAISQLSGGVIVEVGVAKGRGLVCLGELAEFRRLQGAERFELVGVDTFNGTAGEVVEYPSSMEADCRASLERMGIHAHLVKCESTKAAELASQCAYVFLDAAHDYESVKADIAAWWPKIQQGGFLGGHDYDNAEGVSRAVDELFPDAEKISGCWLIRKP